MNRPIDIKAAVAAVAQIVLLAGCTLDRSGLVSPDVRFDMTATIQSDDGVRSVVSSQNLEEFAPGDAPLFGGAEYQEESVAGWYSAYLKMVLDARGGDPVFQDVYGRGPWCLVEVQGTATDVLIEDDERPRLYEGTDELPPCDCGEACGNVPPLAGVLVVSPTAPERPTVVDFGTVPVGVPLAREVELENGGDGLLCLNRPEVDDSSSEHPDDFAVMPLSGCDTTPEGLVLEPGEICRFRATFTPRAAGPRSARVPTARGCGTSVRLEGVGGAGLLTASPAPACFTPPDMGEVCFSRSIRIQNTSTGTVTLSDPSLTAPQPRGWEILRWSNPVGTTVTLPHALPAGQSVLAEVQACELATDENILRVSHNGSDYGAPGSPTGDVDSGSPLAVRLLPRSSGCPWTP